MLMADAERQRGQATAPRASDALFDEVYAQYRGPLYNYIYRLIGDRDGADDLLQETFVKVYRALDSLPEGAGRTPWVYRIATNTCYDVLRRRKLISWLPWTRDVAEPAHGEESLDGRFAAGEAVHDALRQVPPALRAPLLLHVVHGFGYADIAATLNLSEAAVKMRISRARAAFRRAYRDTDEETDG